MLGFPGELSFFGSPYGQRCNLGLLPLNAQTAAVFRQSVKQLAAGLAHTWRRDKGVLESGAVSTHLEIKYVDLGLGRGTSLSSDGILTSLLMVGPFLLYT